MNWLALGGSLLAILLLSGSARLLRLGGASIQDEAEAKRVGAELLPDFDVDSAMVCVRGEAAILFGPGGKAVIRRHGAHFVARRIADAPPVERHWTTVTIHSGEQMFGACVIELENESQARELTRMLATDSD